VGAWKCAAMWVRVSLLLFAGGEKTK